MPCKNTVAPPPPNTNNRRENQKRTRRDVGRLLHRLGRRRALRLGVQPRRRRRPAAAPQAVEEEERVAAVAGAAGKDLLEVPRERHEDPPLGREDAPRRGDAVAGVAQARERHAVRVAVDREEGVLAELEQAAEERERGHELEQRDVPEVGADQAREQQRADQARAKHDEVGKHGRRLGRREEAREQERERDHVVAEQQVEHGLRAERVGREHREADRRAKRDKDRHVDDVEQREPGVRHEPVRAVAEAVHLHHHAQAVLLLVDELHEEDRQQHLHDPREEERPQQAREVEADLRRRLGRLLHADERRGGAVADERAQPRVDREVERLRRALVDGRLRAVGQAVRVVEVDVGLEAVFGGRDCVLM